MWQCVFRSHQLRQLLKQRAQCPQSLDHCESDNGMECRGDQAVTVQVGQAARASFKAIASHRAITCNRSAGTAATLVPAPLCKGTWSQPAFHNETTHLSSAIILSFLWISACAVWNRIEMLRRRMALCFTSFLTCRERMGWQGPCPSNKRPTFSSRCSISFFSLSHSCFHLRTSSVVCVEMICCGL